MDWDAIIGGLAVLLVFGGSVWGVFKTKTPGFGKYTTSALVLTLVLFVAALALVTGKVEWTPLANILFAVAGYAGGLIVTRGDASSQTTP